MKDPSARPGAFALVALLTGATTIALSPIFVRLSETGPTVTAFWRVALAAPIWWAIDAATHPGPPVPWRSAAGASVAFAGDLALWHLSIRLTSVANSTLLSNLASVVVTLGAWLLWRQRPTRLFLVGLGAALAGVALLVHANLRFSDTALAGDTLALVTALFYAWYLMAVKRLRDAGVTTSRVMAATTTATAALLLPVALATGEGMLPATTRGWLLLAGLSAGSQLVGQGLIAYALAHLPAAFSSVSLLVQPVAAAGFAWWMLGETLAPLQAVGGAVVLLGIYLARRGST